MTAMRRMTSSAYADAWPGAPAAPRSLAQRGSRRHGRDGAGRSCSGLLPGDGDPGHRAANPRRLDGLVLVLLGQRAQALVRLGQGALRPLDVDLLARLGSVGEHDHAIVVD